MNSKINIPRYYILVGERKNWKTSIENQIWGFTEKSKGLWNKSNKDELLAYYVTSPIKKIIGFGQIGEKYVDEKLIWNDEKKLKKSIWKYKFKLNHIYVCDDWDEGIPITSKIMLASSRTVVERDQFFEFSKKANQKWNTKIHQKLVKLITDY